MPIKGTKDFEIPAKIYDEYWMRRFMVKAMEPNGPVDLEFELVPSRVVNGVRELADVKPIFIELKDIFAVAAVDEEAAEVITKLLAKVESIAREKGKI